MSDVMKVRYTKGYDRVDVEFDFDTDVFEYTCIIGDVPEIELEKIYKAGLGNVDGWNHEILTF